MAKISKEKFKTMHGVFDNFTERALFKLISQGYFDGLQSPVSIGKEANIFSAVKGDSKVIIKIYRLENCDFNKMYDYIRTDPRFQGIKKSRRKVILAWAQREFRNLILAREAGVKVPKPITFKNNILILEFIGHNDVAPKLKDAFPDNKEKFFEKVIGYVKKLYDAGLVHGDLSEFNILNHDEKPVFIDMSQCTSLETPNSDELFERDVRNVCRFFKKIKLDKDPEKIIKKISEERDK